MNRPTTGPWSPEDEAAFAATFAAFTASQRARRRSPRAAPFQPRELTWADGEVVRTDLIVNHGTAPIDPAQYPAALAAAVTAANRLSSAEWNRRASLTVAHDPWFDEITRQAATARQDLAIWAGSDGHRGNWTSPDGQFGFVAHA